MDYDTIELLKQLISFRSITPNDAGSMGWLVDRISKLGFNCKKFQFDQNDPTVNMYASIGSGGRNLCFAGHLDVVPPGSLDAWKHDPYCGTIVGDMLYGRGAVDMKGAIAAFIAALNRFITEGNSYGTISFLMTSDEEGSGKQGMVKLVKYLEDSNIQITDCLIGEPTSIDRVADMMKIGRRGSINFTLKVLGKQGHVAYPELAHNPIEPIISMMHALKAHAIDLGYDFFQPSHLEFTSVDVGNDVTNIIPAVATTKFNIRFNPHHTAASLIEWVRSVCDKHNQQYELICHGSCEAFLSPKGMLHDVVLNSVTEITGYAPRISTNGGTSDARFIKDLCPVVELGLQNRLAHHVDEAVSISDLLKLNEIYYKILKNYFRA
jgi:succinyl-diaminopimelate desuccinylase